MKIPSGHQALMPYLIMKDAAGFIEFTRKVFGAVTTSVFKINDGIIFHAEIEVQGCTIMFGQSSDKWPEQTSAFYLYTGEVDKHYQKALDNGAQPAAVPEDNLYARACGIKDPFGNTWWLIQLHAIMHILETQRLILREMTASDAEAVYDLNNDPDVIKYTGDEPFKSIAGARIFLENYDHYKNYGYGRWAVILKSTGEFLGWCGLKYEDELDEFDIGFRFSKKYWNQGYATESAGACLDHGFNKLGMKRIVGRAMQGNVGSIRVLQKIGMKYWKECEFDKHAGVVYVKEWSPSDSC